MTALGIGLVVAAWVVLPFPLAVLVGRTLRAGRTVVQVERVPAQAPSALDLTLC